MFKFDLQPNEKALNIGRQSESVLFKPTFLVLILIYLPWFFLFKYEFLTGRVLKLLIFWTLAVLLFAANKFILWMINVHILTNKRLILISYQSLFNKRVLETPLNLILNASFSQKGVLESLFSIGAITVQAQGLTEPLQINKTVHPEALKDAIWQCAIKSKTA